jgi:maltose/moltooligosaccharide transporter
VSGDAIAVEPPAPPVIVRGSTVGAGMAQVRVPDPPGDEDRLAFDYRQLWWLGSGFLGVMLVFSTYNAFLPIMYAEFFDTRVQIGLLMGTDNLVGLLLIPVVGAWSDRMHSPLGRRLPFIVVAVPVAALTFAGIPFAAGALWSLIVVEVLFTAAMHVYRGPVISLLPDHVPPERRSTGNGIISVMGGIGALISFGGLSLIYDRDPRLAFGLGAVALLVTGVIVFAKADRHPPHVEAPEQLGQPLGRGVDGTRPRPIRDSYAGFRLLTRRPNRGQLYLLAAMLAYYVGFSGLDAMFPLYGVATLGLTPGRAAFILTAFVGSFLVFALVAGMIGTRIGKIPTMLTGLAILPVLFLLAAPVRDVRVIVGLFVVGGFAWALVTVQALPLIADLGGRNRIGFYVGMYYLFTMVGNMLGPAVIGSSMDLFGDPGLFYGSAAASAAGFVLLWRGQRLLPAAPEELACRSIELPID